MSLFVEIVLRDGPPGPDAIGLYSTILRRESVGPMERTMGKDVLQAWSAREIAEARVVRALAVLRD